MRTALFAAATVLGLGAFGPQANALGCLSGGAAGALAGHMAGHGILGAIGGCVAGHSWHKHQVSKQNLQNTNAYDQQRKAADPSYQSPWAQRQ